MSLLPFHATVFRIYIDYFRSELGWSEEKIERFVNKLGVPLERLKDDSTWLGLDYSDRFYEATLAESGRQRPAYEAGLILHKRSFNPVLAQLFSGLISVEKAYEYTSRIAARFSKAAKLEVISSRNGEAIIQAIPDPRIPERRYMCENRMGILSGATMLFGLEPAVITHSECKHLGAERCVYVVRWVPQLKFFKEFLFGGVSIGFGIVSAGLIGVTVGISSAFLGCLFAIGSILKRIFDFQKAELSRQHSSLEVTIEEIERKNRQLAVIGQISKLTSTLTRPEDLGHVIVQSVCELLEYDRAILLSTDFQRSVLSVSAFHGFDEKMKELLLQTEFNLSPDNHTGFFIRVVNSKQPLLITDVEASLSQLSARSQKFAKVLGAKSFVAVPLLNSERHVLGVLSVDYTASAKKMTVADQDVLMTLADHLAIALQNANLLQQLEENLELARRFSQEQQVLRENFQKFVPTGVARSLMSLSSDPVEARRQLQLVQKKSAAILFCDLFDYSVLADHHEPEMVVEYLNILFSHLEPHIAQFGGYVDKYTGDGFIAVFEGPECAVQSCASALAILEGLRVANEELSEKSYPEAMLGVGLHYGDVILGNVGSESRLNFTVIGEAVNIAARLESHTRNLGPNTICASAAIIRQSRDSDFSLSDLGPLTLKGVELPVRAFQLLAWAEHSESFKRFKASPTR